MPEKKLYKQGHRLMGNHFEISVVDADQHHAEQLIGMAVAEIRRIESLLTTYSDTSETARINAAAGISPVAVSSETFQLIERSIRISRITQGAFDITYGSVDKSLWNFDTTMTRLPHAGTARKMVRLINYRNIELNREQQTVLLKEKGMRIGFGGIGKGYAAEMAKRLLRAQGAEAGVVNASGDLTTWGNQPDGSPWTIGIVNPDLSGQVFSYMHVTDMAVATSGNYEKYILVDGVKYSHTIHPGTGLPIRGIKSVTVICPNAEIADAMATPVSIMGIEAGLDMINQMQQIEAIVIDDDDRIFTTKNIRFT
jgi:thiamine biosynthesis lipoprotein